MFSFVRRTDDRPISLSGVWQAEISATGTPFHCRSRRSPAKFRPWRSRPDRRSYCPTRPSPPPLIPTKILTKLEFCAASATTGERPEKVGLGAEKTDAGAVWAAGRWAAWAASDGVVWASGRPGAGLLGWLAMGWFGPAGGGRLERAGSGRRDGRRCRQEVGGAADGGVVGGTAAGLVAARGQAWSCLVR
jgi:hypothetical protein